MSVRRASRSASISASAGRASRELIRANMKKMKAARRASREFSANGAIRKDGATKQSASAPVFKHPHPKTELEATSQRHVDSEERYRTLFNLSPMAVYSIDASGVIRDFNRHAAEQSVLFSPPRSPRQIRPQLAAHHKRLVESGRCRARGRNDHGSAHRSVFSLSSVVFVRGEGAASEVIERIA